MWGVRDIIVNRAVGTCTYGSRVGVWDKGTDVVEYGVENPTFLVDDPGDIAVVIYPRCRRLARETPCATKGCILLEESRIRTRGRGPINGRK